MADSKGKKKGRRAYLNDIQPNLAGEYVYTGAYYVYAGKDMSFSKARSRVLFLSMLSMLALIAAGFVRAGGMGNCYYVLIPYMAEAISVFVTAGAAARLLLNGEKLREYIYGAIIPRIPKAAVCSAAFAAVGCVCIIVFIIFNGMDGPAGEMVLLAIAKAVAIAAPLLLRKHVLSLEWKREK